MRNWLLRGLVFAALMVLVRLVQGVLINAWESNAGLISMGLLTLFVIAVAAWGLFDGRSDAEVNPDPDRRGDLAMTWLGAGLFAGVLGGAVAWLISLFDKALYVGGLISELITFSAFTALLVFVPAVAGVTVGRLQVDRHHAKNPQRHHGLAAADGDHADTDVFAAVGVGGQAGASAAAAGDGGAALTEPAYATGWTAEEFPTDTAETEEFPTDTAETVETVTDTETLETAVPVDGENPGESTTG
ncbi:MAG: B-4DMT family transporter [Mycobacterium sp.]